MARQYVAATPGNSTIAGVTIISGLSATATGFKVLRGRVNQSSSTTSGMQRLQVITQASVYFTSATGTLISPLRSDDPSSKFTAMTAATITAGHFGSVASAEGAGTKTVLWEDSFHIFNGWEYIATPYDCLYASASDSSTIGLWFPAAPGTTTGWQGQLWYEEV